MNMKNKNIFPGIVFGLLLAFTGRYADAGAINDLKGGPNFDGAAPRSGDVQQPKPEQPAPAPAVEKKDNAAGKVPALDNKSDEDKKAEEEKAKKKAEEEKKNPVKEFLGKHKTEIFVGALGGYLGFALMGPAGIVAGVLVALGIAFLAGA